MREITANQRSLLQLVAKYWTEHGERPTLRHIVSTLNLAGNKSAVSMIRSLVKKGYLIEAATVTESLRLTDKAQGELRPVQLYEYEPAETAQDTTYGLAKMDGWAGQSSSRTSYSHALLYSADWQVSGTGSVPPSSRHPGSNRAVRRGRWLPESLLSTHHRLCLIHHSLRM